MKELKEIKFEKFLIDLEMRPIKVLTAEEVESLKDFMSTIKGDNKTDALNGIKRLQYFLNAYIQEKHTKANNEAMGIDFAGEDHEGLQRDGHGEKAADFVFKKDGQVYSADCKMYKDKDSYFTNRSKTYFHEADFAFCYFMDTGEAGYTIKEESYDKIHPAEELTERFGIMLPTNLTTINLHTGKVTDDKLKGPVKYYFNRSKRG